MRIGLTYDLQTDPADPSQAEFDPPRTIEAVAEALAALGHEVVRLGGAEQLLAARGGLNELALVMNLAEGTHGRCREAWVPALLEQWGVPFVGSGSAAQALGLDKVMTKRLAVAAGVPTPRWVSVDGAGTIGPELPLAFSVIVKPRFEGSGFGIDPGAVVGDLDGLRRRVRWVTERLGAPCLIEEFIAFGELTVLLIGNDPPEAMPVIQRPLDPVSRLACHVAPAAAEGLNPVELTPGLEAQAKRIAVEVFVTLGCRDVARVDLRVDEGGGLWFLEINPLPSFDPDGSVGLLAEHLGVTYAEMIGRVLGAACVRLGLSARVRKTFAKLEVGSWRLESDLKQP